MASNALQNQKDASFCDVHRLSASERESMERATAEINAEFAAIYEKATPKFDFQSRKSAF